MEFKIQLQPKYKPNSVDSNYVSPYEEIVIQEDKATLESLKPFLSYIWPQLEAWTKNLPTSCKLVFALTPNGQVLVQVTLNMRNKGVFNKDHWIPSDQVTVAQHIIEGDGI